MRMTSRGSTSVAEIEIALPTVQYGNVKVRATPEELGVDIASPAAVGTATAIYLNLFLQGWATGSSMDVTASPTEGLSAPLATSQGEAGPSAQELLNEGLGGVTEVPEDAPPWDKPAVDVPKKPWETENKPVQSVSELISDEW